MDSLDSTNGSLMFGQKMLIWPIKWKPLGFQGMEGERESERVREREIRPLIFLNRRVHITKATVDALGGAYNVEPVTAAGECSYPDMETYFIANGSPTHEKLLKHTVLALLITDLWLLELTVIIIAKYIVFVSDVYVKCISVIYISVCICIYNV